MSSKRYTLFPYYYPHLIEHQRSLQGNHWLVGDIKDLDTDKVQIPDLTPSEVFFLKHVLAFFNQADGIVNENLAIRFYKEVIIPEARHYYSFQIQQESIHAETYSTLLETYFGDDPEKEKLFLAIDNFPSIRKKAEWALQWLKSASTFSERLVAFAFVEGVFFQGSFSAIYWFKEKGILPGLTVANQYISRDEGLHCEFAIDLYKTLLDNYKKFGNCDGMLEEGVVFEPITKETIIKIAQGAVAAEKEFLNDIVPSDLSGINKKLSGEYIECCADYLLKRFGFEAMYNTPNPFPFMQKINMDSSTNFFEKTSVNYTQNISNNIFDSSSDEDF